MPVTVIDVIEKLSLLRFHWFLRLCFANGYIILYSWNWWKELYALYAFELPLDVYWILRFEGIFTFYLFIFYFLMDEIGAKNVGWESLKPKSAVGGRRPRYLGSMHIWVPVFLESWYETWCLNFLISHLAFASVYYRFWEQTWLY